jgi:23S rRNA pseudouridine1911/1915/1917 synthase
MNKIFRDRKVQKTYWAVVKRKPRQKSGKLIHWLKKDTQKNVVTAFDKETSGALEAELNYRVLGKLNDHYLLEVTPRTGRPHQIRVQLAAMGCPIRGDIKYGFVKPNPDGSINLHARKLHFVHPVKKEPITLKAALPENEFWEQFLSLETVRVKEKNVDKLY